MGYQGTEITRSVILDTDNFTCTISTNTVIAFGLQEAVSSGNVVAGKYSIFFGNPSATAPAQENPYNLEGNNISLACPLANSGRCIQNQTPTEQTGNPFAKAGNNPNNGNPIGGSALIKQETTNRTYNPSLEQSGFYATQGIYEHPTYGNYGIGGIGLEAFTVGDEKYLYTGGTRSETADAELPLVYKYDFTLNRWEYHQQLSVLTPKGADSCNINGTHYLFTSSWLSSYKVFKYENGSLIEHQVFDRQALATPETTMLRGGNFTCFTINQEWYIAAVVNQVWYDDVNMGRGVMSIFKLNTDTGNFKKTQLIEDVGYAQKFLHFSKNDEHYGISTANSGLIRLYKFNESMQEFVLIRERTDGIRHTNLFSYNNKIYLPGKYSMLEFDELNEDFVVSSDIQLPPGSPGDSKHVHNLNNELYFTSYGNFYKFNEITQSFELINKVNLAKSNYWEIGYTGIEINDTPYIMISRMYAGQYDIEPSYVQIYKMHSSQNISSVSGDSAIELDTSTDAGEYITTLENPEPTDHTFSVFVKNNTPGEEGGPVTPNEVTFIFDFDEVTPTTYENYGNGWWRVSYTAIPNHEVGLLYGVKAQQGKNIYIDGLQLEEGSKPSPYFDGDSGGFWDGEQYYSSSTRDATSLKYGLDSNLDASAGSVSLWFQPGWNGDNGLEHTIWEATTDSGELKLFKQSSNELVVTDGSNYASVDFGSINSNTWNHVVVNWSTSLNRIELYLNNSIIDISSSYSQPVFTSGGDIVLGNNVSGDSYLSGYIANFRIYDSPLEENEIAQIYNSANISKNYTPSSDRQYSASGTWVGDPIDLINNGAWGDSPNMRVVQNLNNQNITYETRTSPDTVSWSPYQPVTGSNGNYNVTSPPNRYVQVRATLTSDTQTITTLPSFSGITFNYAEDGLPPIENASGVVMFDFNGGNSLSSGAWVNNKQSYFTWNAGEDDVDGSGIGGYCVYLGLDPSGDPAISKGVLDSSPLPTNSTTCQFIVPSTELDLADFDPNLISSTDTYYLNIKAVDATGNVYAGDSVGVNFKYDSVPPIPPNGLSAPQEYRRKMEDFTITWSTSGINMGTDDASQIAGYQYRINDGDWVGLNGTGECQDLILDGSYTLQDDIDTLTIGENVFYLRAVDNACNYSKELTAILKYSANAPSRPLNLDVNVPTNDVNEFSFTWAKPDFYLGDSLEYCYTVNTIPTEQTCFWTTTESLPLDAYATQPGKNVMYVIAMDEAGHVNYADYASVEFSADTPAPGIPRNVELFDVSIKDAEDWRLNLSWGEPEYIGAGVESYKIYRAVGDFVIGEEVEQGSEDGTESGSTNNETEGGSSVGTNEELNCLSHFGKFEEISKLQGRGFVDGDLEQRDYFYCVRACDSANNCSAISQTVTEYPIGRYYEPAGLVGSPEAVDITTRKATITWFTDRESDSKVAYGLESGDYMEEEVSISEQVTDHNVDLDNLDADTTYYYKVRWTDEDGNTGESAEHQFTTQPPPEVKDIRVVDISINTALVEFTTIGASQVNLYYGQTTSFGGLEEIQTSTSEQNHTIKLSGLLDGTKYYFRVNALDSEGNEFDNVGYWDFTTLVRPQITNVEIQEIEGAAQPAVLVEWESNTDISSILTYNVQGEPDSAINETDPNYKTKHRMLVINLVSQTKYELVLQGTDIAGNNAVSDTYTFDTKTDTRPPVIRNIKIEKTILDDAQNDNNAQVIISWETDEDAKSFVEYGEGSSGNYNNKLQGTDSYETRHVVVVSNLDPATGYSFRLSSTDEAGNQGFSSNYIIVTPEGNQDAIQIIFDSFSRIFGF